MTAGRKRVRVSAFAKINLDLRVLARRPDGYHELRTTFQSIALADTLTFTRNAGAFRIVCSDPACPTDERNLVWRAAALVWKAARRRGGPKGVTVRIDKRVPMQAGLGGGSSDAAAALRALAKWWRVRIAPDELRRLAATIGADVPYFLEGGTALGLRRGDVLVPLDDIARAWMVLVVPDFGVSTKDAFGWWDQEHAGRDGRERQDGRGGQERREGQEAQRRRRLRSRQANDLQPVVAARHPIIRRLTRALEREGASRASLSGSGSAVFGLFGSRLAAERAAAALTGGHIVVTRTLSRKECGKLAAT
jgi:4-diphosphocytidyl-2-C-methyl-D-erythritol kinase